MLNPTLWREKPRRRSREYTKKPMAEIETRPAAAGPRSWRGLWFSAFALLVSAVTFAALALVAGGSFSVLGVVAALALGVLWLVTMALAGAFLQQYALFALQALLAPGVVVLGGFLQPGALVAAVLLLVTLFAARAVLQQDQRERVVPSSVRAFTPGLKLLAMGLVLVVAGLSIAPVERTLDATGLQLSEAYVASLIRPLEPALGNFLPGQVTSNTTLDEVIDQQITNQLLPGVTPSPAERARLEATIAEQLNLSTSTAKLGQQSLSSVVTERINATLQQLTEGRSMLVALVLVLLVLLAARILLTPLTWLAAVLTVAALAAAVRVGLFTKTPEQITVERLTL